MTLVVSDAEEPVARELNPGMPIGIDLRSILLPKHTVANICERLSFDRSWTRE